MRVRAGLISAIYRKALLLSNDERSSRPAGDVVNLMSVDATRLQDFCTYGLIAVSGPLQVNMNYSHCDTPLTPVSQITLALVSLYNLLGPATFPGVAIMIISIPLNTLIAKRLKSLNETQMKNRDMRTRLMSELLTNIKRHVISNGIVYRGRLPTYPLAELQQPSPLYLSASQRIVTIRSMLMMFSVSKCMLGNSPSCAESWLYEMIWNSRC
jgi:hypothetical protein